MRVDIDHVKKESTGKWRGIFGELGITIPEHKKHGPCPIEDAGVDRFYFDDKEGRGTWHCNNCGAGDGFALLMLKYGWTFIQTAQEVGKVVSSCEFVCAPQEQDDEKKKAFMNEIWAGSGPLTGSDLATKYLRSRGILISPDTKQVHLNAACYESETKTKMPAMVCMVRDQAGKPIGLHRTYLNDQAGKAKLECVRKSIGKTACGAIRLMPVSDVVGVAEGIESALSASQLFDLPVWAVISAVGMESFMPPEGVRKVVIFGDNDATFTGQKSAYALANKLYLRDFLVDDPQIPVERGCDWNDVLKKQIGGK